MRLLTTARFEKDVKRVKRRGKNLRKLWEVVEVLLDGHSLPSRNRVHRLAGKWSRCWECHIEPDWLLIWENREDMLVLIRTGTHTDLFC